MSSCKFIHAADVHLDSPLGSLRQIDEAAANRLQRASRRSLESIVQYAIEYQVDAVVIAGDLFDAPVKDAGAGLWANSQLRRLTREGIAVVLIRGNHDALSNAHRTAKWSEGVQEFDSKQPATIVLDNCGLAFHGQSFGARTELNDLAAHYPDPIDGCFNVGVLHTSLSGTSTQHDTYAPTSVAVLEGKGYDYWALGHIHVRSKESHSNQCYIGYSGNTQGRHIREQGAKGCQLVTVLDGQIASTEFLATDSLRWYEVSIDASALDHLYDLDDLVEQKVVELLASAEGRSLALRVSVSGATSLHDDLSQLSTQSRLSETLSQRFLDLGDVWLEKVSVQTVSQIRNISADLDLPLKYLRLVADELREDSGQNDELKQILEELLRKTRTELADTDFPLLNRRQEAQAITEFLNQAEHLLVGRISKVEEQ